MPRVMMRASLRLTGMSRCGAEVPCRFHEAVHRVLPRGGGSAGSIDRTGTIARKLAERTSSTVVPGRLSIGVRRTPDPAAVDDRYAASSGSDSSFHEIAGEDVPLMVAVTTLAEPLSSRTMLAREPNGRRILHAGS